MIDDIIFWLIFGWITVILIIWIPIYTVYGIITLDIDLFLLFRLIIVAFISWLIAKKLWVTN